MRAIIYARYSTDRQADSSIADQLRVCRQYAQQHGWQVVGEHRDEGISGAAIGNRPAVRAALSQLERGDVLLVMDLSRLSRSQDIGPMISQQTFRGVRVVGVQDGYDSSSRTARMQAGLSGIMSEELRAGIADRTRSALVMRAEHGDPTGGRAYGYREGEADVVREIFELWTAGQSLKQIASTLNARAIPAPGASWTRERRARHGRWLGSCVRAMLQNDRYVGRLIYNRSQWVKDPVSGVRKRIERPQSEWIERQVEPLVDRETWGMAQARFRRNTLPAAPRRYLLSGLLKCALCGSHMTVMGGSQHRYACSTHRNGGPHACVNALTVPRTTVEQYVLEPVMTRLLDPDSIAEAMRQMRALAREQQAELEDPQVGELRRMVREGMLSAEVAAPAIAEAQRRSGRSAVIALPSERMWREAVSQIRSVLEGEDITAAREVLMEYLGEIPMQPDGDRYVATIRARAVWLATGTGGGRYDGSGGVIFSSMPTRRGG
jgi:DNA invertase Pin-like site-specific DNA recombinase